MKMSELVKKSGNANDPALHDDLERRYGPAMAQEIVDLLRKAENPAAQDNEPVDYLSIKALSEGSELYRREARSALTRLKASKGNVGCGTGNVVCFDEHAMLREFERSFGFYRRFHQAFYVLYRQAMEAYRVGAYVPAGRAPIDRTSAALAA